jgi:hypothetical protein
MYRAMLRLITVQGIRVQDGRRVLMLRVINT